MEKVLLSLVIVSTCSLQLMASPTSKTEEVVDTMFLRKQFQKSFQIDDVVICAPYARSVSVYAPLNTSIGKKLFFIISLALCLKRCKALLVYGFRRQIMVEAPLLLEE
ncbi:hypothetical protein [Segatella copri]|uniref:hypothetical protein n=1 Tax=Segatella copri TaxID=165179 RepID=UPI003F6F844F